MRLLYVCLCARSVRSILGYSNILRPFRVLWPNAATYQTACWEGFFFFIFLFFWGTTELHFTMIGHWGSFLFTVEFAFVVLCCWAVCIRLKNSLSVFTNARWKHFFFVCVGKQNSAIIVLLSFAPFLNIRPEFEECFIWHFTSTKNLFFF